MNRIYLVAVSVSVILISISIGFSAIPGVKPTNIAACEPKVKFDGAFALCNGPIFFILGTTAFSKVSYLQESRVINRKDFEFINQFEL